MEGSPPLIWISLGNGDGTFKTSVSYSVGQYATNIVSGDFNNDGKQDLAVLNRCGSDPACGGDASITVLIGSGDGTFVSQPASTGHEARM